MTDSTQTLERLATSDYKYGFVTDIEQDTVPPGLNEDVIRLISAKKQEPDWLLEWRLQAYRHWLTQKQPEWARVDYPPIDYQALSYYAAPKQKGDGPKSLDEVDPSCFVPTKAWYSAGGTSRSGRRGGGRGVRFGIGGDQLQGQAGRTGHRVLLVLRGGARASRAGAQVSGYGGAISGQLLRDAEFGGVFRRFLRLHPAGRALPDGTVHLLPHQRQQHRPVRTDADHCRRGAYVSYLEGCTAPQRDENQLHAAVVELVTLDNATIKYSTVQNWYPGDAEGKGGIYNFVTKRGLCKGRDSKISWTRSRPVRPSPGSIQAACCAAKTRWASSTRWP